MAVIDNNGRLAAINISNEDTFALSVARSQSSVINITPSQVAALDKVLDVLENDTNEVFVDEELAQCALKPLNKMLELAAK